MAGSTISTNGGNGKEVKVFPTMDQDEDLEHAAAILDFMSLSIPNIACMCVSKETALGMSLCLDLARDKLLRAKGDME